MIEVHRDDVMINSDAIQIKRRRLIYPSQRIVTLWNGRHPSIIITVILPEAAKTGGRLKKSSARETLQHTVAVNSKYGRQD